MIALLYALSMAATTAHAEHKLLITDVLSARQFEVEADFGYAHNSVDYTRKYPSYDPNMGILTGYIDVPGTQKRNIVSSLYSLGIGIGSGLQLNIAMPYVHVDNIKQQDSPGYTVPAWDREQDGVGDIAVGVKYSLYENKEKAVSVVTGLDAKLFTADSNKAGTGTNDIAPFIAASTVIYGDLRPYASYQAIFRDHGAADSHIVAAGIEYELNKTFSVTPEFSAIFRTDSAWATAYNTYTFGLTSSVNIFSNLYLIPHVNMGISTSTAAKNHSINYETLKFVSAGLGLYCLF